MGLWSTSRFVSMNLMIGAFIVVIYNGALAIALSVMLLQAGVSYEICSIGIKPKLERHLSYLKKLRCYIFIVGTLYLTDGWMIKDLILRSDNWLLLLLFENQLIYVLILFVIALIWFVLELNHHHDNVPLLRYQYAQLSWALSIALVMACTSPIIRVTFDGIIWSILPMSTVVANDILAYGFGKLFGKHPLTQLSPKKSWEGYIYSGIATIPFGYLLADCLMKYDTLLCPTDRFAFGRCECERNTIFIKTEYDICGYIVNIEPFQMYNVMISLWIAIVCPIGGFMASGYKRAFGLDNYGSVIPGHGGITDRMDAEILMCGFVYLIHQMTKHPLSVDEIEIDSALTNEQRLILIKMLEKLVR